MGFFDFFRRKTSNSSLINAPVSSKAAPEIRFNVYRTLESYDDSTREQDRDICEAICKGDVDSLQRFIDEGKLKDLDRPIRPDDCANALHVAVSEGSLNSVKCLIRNGASIDVFNKDGKTALDFAIRKSQSHMSTELIALKADIFARHNGGRPLIYYHTGQILKKRDVNTAVKPIFERTLMDIKAGDGKAFLNWIDGDVGMIYPQPVFEDLKAAYLAAGGDPEIRDIKGHSLDELSRIYRSKARFAEFSTELDRGYCREILSSPELLQEALEIGVLRPKSHVFDVIGKANGTPLQHICEWTGERFSEEQAIHLARILLEHGASPNDPAPTYSEYCIPEPPLIMALKEGHSNLACFLIENGADPNPVDMWNPDYKLNALGIAIDNSDIKSVTLLAQKGCTLNDKDINVLRYAPEMMRLFFEYGLVDTPGLKDGTTILHEAVKGDHLDEVAVILEFHPHLRSMKDDYGRLPEDYCDEECREVFRRAQEEEQSGLSPC